jgi:poly-gamma-glutamate capsule biosynthesis protein CapA/YwtB (metallophosphatase superfamily)
LTKYKDSKVTKNFAKVFLATFVVIAVLDDSGNQRVVLQPVSDELAGKAGLSAQEAQAYNSELDVAQQVLDQISSEVAQASEQDRVAVAHTSWEKYRGMMSVDAFNGLLKLTAAAVNS